jgi:hypothetical protein
VRLRREAAACSNLQSARQAKSPHSKVARQIWEGRLGVDFVQFACRACKQPVSSHSKFES